MDAATLATWAAAVVLVVISLFKPGKLYIQGLKRSAAYIYDMLPRIFMALLVSGFFSVLIPTDLVANWLGQESGVRGILIGSLVGGFTPGGPIICFPIAVVLVKSGAAIPPLVAFLTAWSVFAFHRIVAYEAPLVGMRFVRIRILSSLILPPLAGFQAALLEAGLGKLT
jgi:uncharacterized membrane protein YraQ (UPF0718 family)